MYNHVLPRICFVSSLICCPAAAGEPHGVDLASLGDWDIVVAEDALPSEKYAAEELQQHVALATGHTLPVFTCSDRPDRHVFVDPSKAMCEGELGFAVDDFGPEDLRIVIRDGNIAIVGGRPRGTLYGVYTFLDHITGTRSRLKRVFGLREDESF